MVSRPESRGARIPAGALLILGGFLSIMPILGLWMLPPGLIRLAEDLSIVWRGVIRASIGWKTAGRAGSSSAGPD